MTSQASRRGRILIVDDEAMVGAAVQRALRSDHDATFVESAKDALALLSKGERFELILCDLMMPAMSGMDLHREIAETIPDQARRMVFLTGGAYTPKAREFLEKTPNPRLEKPFDLEKLVAFVNQLLT